MLALLRGIFAALPDAITASVFVAAWFYPLRWGQGLVGNLVLTMLLEFIVVHSSGFLGAAVYSPGVSRRQRTLVVLGFGAFYFAFVLAFAFAFHSSWVIVAFSWLLLSKLITIWFQPGTADIGRQKGLWAMSALFYVLGAFVTVVLPLPHFGLTREVASNLGLPGRGLWVDQPHVVMAFGTLYFGLLAAAKWSMAAKVQTIASASVAGSPSHGSK